MTRPAGGLVLFDFGPVTIHLARHTPWPGTCAACHVLLALAAQHADDADGCHDCPGPVAAAPAWALLTAEAPPVDAVELGEAA